VLTASGPSGACLGARDLAQLQQVSRAFTRALAEAAAKRLVAAHPDRASLPRRPGERWLALLAALEEQGVGGGRVLRFTACGAGIELAGGGARAVSGCTSTATGPPPPPRWIG
jgi:hypothetical protein